MVGNHQIFIKRWLFAAPGIYCIYIYSFEQNGGTCFNRGNCSTVPKKKQQKMQAIITPTYHPLKIRKKTRNNGISLPICFFVFFTPLSYSAVPDSRRLRRKSRHPSLVKPKFKNICRCVFFWLVEM